MYEGYNDCKVRVVGGSSSNCPIAIETYDGDTDRIEITEDEALLLISDLIAAL